MIKVFFLMAITIVCIFGIIIYVAKSLHKGLCAVLVATLIAGLCGYALYDQEQSLYLIKGSIALLVVMFSTKIVRVVLGK